MIITIENMVLIQEENSQIRQEIKNRLTIQNPAWLENDKMGRWNGDTPEILRFYRETPAGLEVPRGFISQTMRLAKRSGQSYRIEDRRRSFPPVDFTFTGQLRPFQEEAVRLMLSRDFGTLAAPTGSGKTVMALAMVAHRKQPALIITHTKELQHQWVDRIGQFLQIPASEIGQIGDGERTMGDRITVALVQSLFKCAKEVSPRVGYLVVDECHRTPSRTFTEAVTAFDCKFMTGLSATPWRRDHLSKLIFWHAGDVAHEIPKSELIETGDVLRAEVVTRETHFESSFDPTMEYSKMLSELTEDRDRNELIVQDVAREAMNGAGICLILSDRKSHCKALRDLLFKKGIHTHLLTGDLANGARKSVVEDLNAGRIKVLVATGQLIGEGFDCKELSILFLATPVKFDGRVLQYLGRVLRPAPGKEYARLYDYVDVNVNVLKASAAARRRVYARN